MIDVYEGESLGFMSDINVGHLQGVVAHYNMPYYARMKEIKKSSIAKKELK
jgi:hypothetical protein